MRHAFGAVVPLGQAPAARILEVVEACRPRAARRAQPDQRAHAGRRGHAVAARLRRGGRHRPRAGARPRRASAPTTTAPARPRRPARWRRWRSSASRACRSAGGTAATAATARCGPPWWRRSHLRTGRDRLADPVLRGRAGRLRPRPRDRPEPGAACVSTELHGRRARGAREAPATSAELAALQAQIEPHFLFNALNTIAAFCRTQPDEARRLVLAFADYCRSSLRRPAAFVRAGGRAGPRRRVPGAGGGALRRLAGDRAPHRARPRCPRACRRSSCSRWSRTRSSTARPTGRCASRSAPTSASAGCA